jgi:hypothetical protein
MLFRFVIPFVLTMLAQALVLAQSNPELRAELLAMEKVDQDARMRCTTMAPDEQAKCFEQVSITIDAPNTKRLSQLFDRYGFPGTAKVGKDGFQAFMIVLQHSPTDDLRVKSLEPITKAFRGKELPPMAYANFIDRLRLHQGKKQLYGSGFDMKDGKFVMSPTQDVKNLEKRRARIGLPPMAEYVRDLEELYHVKAVYP